MSKKIIKIRAKIKKSFLCISSASFHKKVGKHSTIKYSYCLDKYIEKIEKYQSNIKP